MSAYEAVNPPGWSVLVEQPVDEAFEPVYASMLRTVVLLLVGLALAVVASLLLARRMVTPIRALQEGAARIGAGALDQQIAVHTGDELETLADTFNQMTAQLASRTPTWSRRSRNGPATSPSRSNSRRRPPRSCGSSRARPTTSSRSSTPSPSAPPASATRTTPRVAYGRRDICARSRATRADRGTAERLTPASDTARCRRAAVPDRRRPSLGEPSPSAGRSISTMSAAAFGG